MKMEHDNLSAISTQLQNKAWISLFHKARQLLLPIKKWVSNVPRSNKLVKFGSRKYRIVEIIYDNILIKTIHLDLKGLT